MKLATNGGAYLHDKERNSLGGRKMALPSLVLVVLILAIVGCTTGPTREEIRATVEAEVQVAIAKLKPELVGPTGPEGPRVRKALEESKARQVFKGTKETLESADQRERRETEDPEASKVRRAIWGQKASKVPGDFRDPLVRRDLDLMLGRR
jgi:hypothetical protein